MIVDRLVSLHKAYLVWLLYWPEVLILVKWESSVRCQSAECFIFHSFLERSKFIASLGNNSTVILDRVNDLTESVKLSDTLWGNNNASIFIDNNLGSCRSINDDTIVLAWKVYIHFGQLFLELLKWSWQSGKDKVWWWAPVENLGREAMYQLWIVKRVCKIIVLNSSYKRVKPPNTYQWSCPRTRLYQLWDRIRADRCLIWAECVHRCWG